MKHFAMEKNLQQKYQNGKCDIKTRKMLIKYRVTAEMTPSNQCTSSNII